MACFQLAFGMRVVPRWVPTKRNHADGPSRGHNLGMAPETLPAPKLRRSKQKGKEEEAPKATEMPDHFVRITG